MGYPNDRAHKASLISFLLSLFSPFLYSFDVRSFFLYTLLFDVMVFVLIIQSFHLSNNEEKPSRYKIKMFWTKNYISHVRKGNFNIIKDRAMNKVCLRVDK